jgi:hypothetical protein
MANNKLDRLKNVLGNPYGGSLADSNSGGLWNPTPDTNYDSMKQFNQLRQYIEMTQAAKVPTKRDHIAAVESLLNTLNLTDGDKHVIMNILKNYEG